MTTSSFNELKNTKHFTDLTLVTGWTIQYVWSCKVF